MPLYGMPARVLAVAVVAAIVRPCAAWQKWDYLEKNVSTSFEEWTQLWGYSYGPRSRRGHSMVLYGTRAILFAGRDNEVQRNHVPRTYQISNINGSLEFTTYDEEPVLAKCKAGADGNETAAGGNHSEECVNMVDVGLYYNDVWSYELNCTRFADDACELSNWRVEHPGGIEGACKIVLGVEICTTPSERWMHGAAMYDDGTMLIYGGFSQRCEDYCDDLWSFDLKRNTWMEIDAIGQMPSGGAGPSKRVKFSLVFSGKKMWLFGGFRLWHGFASDNAEENLWGSRALAEEGGYMNDFWTYTKRLLAPDELMPTTSVGLGKWENITSVQFCEDAPGDTWETRSDIACTVTWPRPRAGHVAVLDEQRDGMWLHGGYTTFFPYLLSTGTGSGYGTQSASSSTGSFSPYPTYPYYLDDLWFYNMTSGYWREIKPLSTSNPTARMDHKMILADQILIMFGGYSHNHHYGDTWLFNASSTRWLEKKYFVHERYPANCTDDMEFIASNESNCFKLEWTKPLSLDNKWLVASSRDQDYYVPDVDWGRCFGRYYGIIDYGAPTPTEYSTHGTPLVPYAATGPNQYVMGLRWWPPETPDDVLRSEDHGLRVDDEEAAERLQYNTRCSQWRQALAAYMKNSTVNGTLYERCTSVKGEPTRPSSLVPPRETDGIAGRSPAPIFLPQPRRQSPGWDGCRDRDDGNMLLPQELVYLEPSQRSDHTMIYTDILGQKGLRPNGDKGFKPGEIYIFGGVGYDQTYLPSTSETRPSYVLSDMWRLGVHDCPSNCSWHGECNFGFCFCHPGYYGIDCSNTSCPGDYCFYDDDTNLQQCQHCCQAGYNHTDDDVYVTGVQKVPCNIDSKQQNGFFGESNGICDGFGQCQCAPPFIGDDCSIKDCKHNCSFNGWCSIEFPNSRCMCNPGYFGEWCEWLECLNDCSAPNGVCNHTTGHCTCAMTYSPYDNQEEWKRWGGEDCSYISAYAAAPRAARLALWALWAPLLAFALMAFDGE